MQAYQKIGGRSIEQYICVIYKKALIKEFTFEEDYIHLNYIINVENFHNDGNFKIAGSLQVTIKNRIIQQTKFKFVNLNLQELQDTHKLNPIHWLFKEPKFYKEITKLAQDLNNELKW